MNNITKRCQCRICERHREYEKHFRELGGSVSRGAATFFKDIYEDLNMVEMERDRHKAVINGTWPT